jgi:hypothetical protein
MPTNIPSDITINDTYIAPNWNIHAGTHSICLRDGIAAVYNHKWGDWVVFTQADATIYLRGIYPIVVITGLVNGARSSSHYEITLLTHHRYPAVSTL